MVPEPEQRLWYYLRNKRLNGLKFKRQYSVGRYIVDFYCAELHVAIELDGDSHYTDDAQEYDRIRTEYLNANNIRVLRFTNTEAMQNTKEVLQRITSLKPSP